MNKLILLSMVPVWVWAALLASGGLVVVLLIVVAISGDLSSKAADLHNQCDSAVGPDPSLKTTEKRSADSVLGVQPSSAMPTENPYAKLTIAPSDTSVSDWHRACVRVLKSAPYQSPPLQATNSGPAAFCARELALLHLEGARPSDAGDGESGMARMARSVIYGASAAGLNGQCAPLVPPVDTTSRAAGAGGAPAPAGAGSTAAPAGGVQSQPDSTTVTPCGQLDSGSRVVVLPNELAAQGVCGQRVDPSAISPGDLVYWGYREYAPTYVGIAVGPRELVTMDSVSGKPVLQLIPTSSEVRVKRVLGGGPS